MWRGRIGLVVLMLAGSAAGAQEFDDEFYDELDAFAVAHLNSMQAMSIRENTEFCGYIGLDANQQFVATGPTRGGSDSCMPADPPAGVEVFASWHTHGAYSPDYDAEVPSLDDLIGDIEEGVDGYIATPGGRVWLDLYEEGSAVMLCGRGCVMADPAFVECGAYLPEEEYSVDALEGRFDNDPGFC